MEIGSLFAEFPWGWNEFLPWCSFELLQVTMSPSFWINKPELIIYKVWILYVTACQSFISAPYTLLGCLELSLAWAMPSHRVSFWWWERLVRSPPMNPICRSNGQNSFLSVLPSHDIFIGVLWHPKLKKGIERVGLNFQLFSQILLHVSDRVTKLPGTGDCRSRATVVSWGCVQEANLVMEWFRPALSRLGLVIRLRLVSVLNGQYCLLSIYYGHWIWNPCQLIRIRCP